MESGQCTVRHRKKSLCNHHDFLISYISAHKKGRNLIFTVYVEWASMKDSVEKNLKKNYAIAMILAVKENFYGSNWIKFLSVPSWREKKSEQTWWIPTPWIDLNVSYGQLNSIIYIGHNCQSFWFGTLILSRNTLFESNFPIEFTKSKICSIKQKKTLISKILQYANNPKMEI